MPNESESREKLEKVMRANIKTFVLITMREIDGGARVDVAYQVRLRKKRPRATCSRADDRSRNIGHSLHDAGRDDGSLGESYGIFRKLDELADLNSSRFHAIESHKMLIAWILAVVSIVLLGYFFHGQNVVFSGIAEAAETTISMPEAVEVVKIHVIPGEEVHPGDTLVELRRPHLALRMNELKRQLDVSEGRGNLNSADIDQKVAEIQSDLNLKRNTILLEIDKLTTQMSRTGRFPRG